MKRQKFSREYKLEAVKQVRDRQVSSAQVAKELGVGANVVSRWVREASGDIRKAFPGQGQQSADQAEIERLKREIIKLKAEKDILKNVWSAPEEQDLSSIPVASRFASMYPAY